MIDSLKSVLLGLFLTVLALTAGRGIGLMVGHKLHSIPNGPSPVIQQAPEGWWQLQDLINGCRDTFNTAQKCQYVI